ncbi:MarR family transcriptional regulator [Spiroplasma helicoides]|uniref:MarR family transcriptional regulator n=1 Tax=Spiroplasma helicoides TaxID=216938 RepID=A0A1B3SLU2_9MOLU|nr:helix-turn-helix domain-containing protein [Spiroplasma helicoides]AOG60893.1 MarR family transcriptional regulator [Spiroplasma helicoides]
MNKCPVETSLKVLKNKWTIFIVRDLLTGEKRFGELKKSINGITTKVLSESLKHLESYNIVKRWSNDTFPLVVVYSLTPLGLSLKQILDALTQWFIDNEKEINF